MAPVLIVSGPVGVGKTAVAFELSTVLEQHHIAHTVIDLDGLAATYPRPDNDRFGNSLGLSNLRDVWRNCAASGSKNLVVARVVESPDDVAAINAAVGGSASVVRLRAPVAVLQERLRQRESGPSLTWYLDRAAELSRSLEISGPGDLVVDTEIKTAGEIATEIFAAIDWQL